MRRPFAPAPVGDLVAAVLDPVLRRKAGMTVGLLGAWAEIVGSKLETATRPEKLVWPPGAVGDDTLRPATLVVACEGVAALRLQHQTNEVIQRVNVFFGYRAVDRLRILQKPVALPPRLSRKPKQRALSAAEQQSIAAMTERIEDPKLKAALEAYGASILGRKRTER